MGARSGSARGPRRRTVGAHPGTGRVAAGCRGARRHRGVGVPRRPVLGLSRPGGSAADPGNLRRSRRGRTPGPGHDVGPHPPTRRVRRSRLLLVVPVALAGHRPARVGARPGPGPRRRVARRDVGGHRRVLSPGGTAGPEVDSPSAGNRPATGVEDRGRPVRPGRQPRRRRGAARRRGGAASRPPFDGGDPAMLPAAPG